MTPPLSEGCGFYNPPYQRGCGFYDLSVASLVMINECPLRGLWILKGHHTSRYISSLSLISVSKRSSCCDTLPEWGRSIISNGNFQQISPTEQAGKIRLIFPAWSVDEIWWSLSMENFSSALFWQRVVPTAFFKDWYFRIQLVRWAQKW